MCNRIGSLRDRHLKGGGGVGKRIPGAREARKTREGSVGNACKDAMGFFRFSHLPE